MSRPLQILSIVLLGSLAIVVPLHAELSVFSSYTVPGLDHPIQRLDLADVDSDGLAEVLAFDGTDFVLYSPSADSSYFNLSLDSIVTSMEPTNCMEVRGDARILLADINRDSLLDASILVGLLCDPGNPYTSSPITRYVLAFIDDVTSGSRPVGALEMEFESALGIGLVDAIDFDGDGYDNLIVSVDSSVFWEYFPSLAWDYSFGKTLIYHSFPDSVISRVEAVMTAAWPIIASDGSPAILAADRDWFWEDYTGIGPEATTIEGVTLLSPDGPTLSHRERQAFAVCIDDWQGATWTSLLQPRLVEDVIAATPQLEVLCTHYDYEHAYECDTSAHALIAYELTDADTLRELWSIDAGSRVYRSFLIDVSFPDQFFAFAGDTLMRFDATDGSLLKQYPPLPPGAKFWDYPYGGEEPYLVLVNDRTVSYYTFDEVTDVESPSTTLLPTSFTLGQPYPNPFNPSVTVPITVSSKGHLKVEVYNPLGQRVGVLHDAVTSPGEFTLTWDATAFGSGVYLIKATLGEETRTAKAVLVK